MIRILVVDDDPFIRESLRIVLDINEEIKVAGVSANGQEAVEFIETNGPVDLVLMDIRMPVCDGVEGTKRIKARSPETAVLILTTFEDDAFILEALRNGAGGYMLKNVPPDQIIAGIKTVHQGNMLIHPNIARKMAGLLSAVPAQGGAVKAVEKRDATTSEDTADPLDGLGLTPAEQAVVIEIAGGLSNKEIAQKLFLSEGTVKNNVTEILGKLSLRDRTQIAIFYWKKARDRG
ncbi:response regulator transcription factor [Gorillibacterium massiliense]|uniref:response regulator transcription factor n=1 Tax=Gorillibacterium massiliense TaxID=1280390 RepID=UPI0004BAE166|nr:response regulator transcription factor [Gorillibacterium massiliense]